MNLLSSAQLEHLKSCLLIQKKDILNKAQQFKEEQIDQEKSRISEEAEAASADVDNSLSIHLYERDRRSLLMIEKALSKIAEGTYGLCERCQDAIHSARLVARPFTPLCIDCMEDQESRLPRL